MYRIKLSATHSTNAYLKQLSAEEELPDMCAVRADDQQSGRGQPGAVWLSEPGKNLTFSVLKRFSTLKAQDHFQLNMCVSLAVAELLDRFGIPDVLVKWPNDILSGRRKLCGILLENTLRGDLIDRSIIGIGLNVNQVQFKGLPGATSMAMQSGKEFNLDDLWDSLLDILSQGLSRLEGSPYSRTREAYDGRLFGMGRPAVYRTPEEGPFMGINLGTNDSGQLIVEREDGSRESFGFREIRQEYGS